jgi:enterochelin esterase family protein
MKRILVALCISVSIGVAAAQVSEVQTPPRPKKVNPKWPVRDVHTPGYVKATELPDGMVPPPDVDGNFILGPTHTPAPELDPPAKELQGSVITFTMRSADSKIYPGIGRDHGSRNTFDPHDPAKVIVTDSHPMDYTREVAVYVPKGYMPGTPAPFIVDQDGPDKLLFAALDKLRTATARAANAAWSMTPFREGMPSLSKVKCCRALKLRRM